MRNPTEIRKTQTEKLKRGCVSFSLGELSETKPVVCQQQASELEKGLSNCGLPSDEINFG